MEYTKITKNDLKTLSYKGPYGQKSEKNMNATKNVLYATFNPSIGVEMRSKKINRHHIIRKN